MNEQIEIRIANNQDNDTLLTNYLGKPFPKNEKEEIAGR